MSVSEQEKASAKAESSEEEGQIVDDEEDESLSREKAEKVYK